MKAQTDGTAALEVIEEKRGELDKQTEQVDRALVKAFDVTITAQASANKVAGWLTASKERKRFLDGWKDEVVGPIYRTYKKAQQEFALPSKKYGVLIGILSAKLGAWNAQLSEQARKQEQAIREVHEREAAERQKELEAEAAKAKAAGDAELAEELRVQAETVKPMPSAVVAHLPPKYDGLVQSGAWKGKVVDRQEFETGVLSGEIDPMYANIAPDGPAINRYAKRKEGAAKMPGVEFQQVTGFAGKG